MRFVYQYVSFERKWNFVQTDLHSINHNRKDEKIRTLALLVSTEKIQGCSTTYPQDFDVWVQELYVDAPKPKGTGNQKHNQSTDHNQSTGSNVPTFKEQVEIVGTLGFLPVEGAEVSCTKQVLSNYFDDHGAKLDKFRHSNQQRKC